MKESRHTLGLKTVMDTAHVDYRNVTCRKAAMGSPVRLSRPGQERSCFLFLQRRPMLFVLHVLMQWNSVGCFRREGLAVREKETRVIQPQQNDNATRLWLIFFPSRVFCVIDLILPKAHMKQAEDANVQSSVEFIQFSSVQFSSRWTYAVGKVRLRDTSSFSAVSETLHPVGVRKRKVLYDEQCNTKPGERVNKWINNNISLPPPFSLTHTHTHRRERSRTDKAPW